MLKSLALLILILCTTLVVNGATANIVQQTCSKTPNPALCIQYLNADPKSSTADVSGLALIMVNVIKSKANIAVNKIKQLSGSIPPGGQKGALMLCSTRYTSIMGDVLLATRALQNRNPKFAVDNANDAVIEANSCEDGFFGKSPLTTENNATRDASAITSAICRLLY